MAALRDEEQSREFDRLAKQLVADAAGNRMIRSERLPGGLHVWHESSAAGPGFAAWTLVHLDVVWDGERARWRVTARTESGSTETSSQTVGETPVEFDSPGEALAVVRERFGF